MRCLMKKYFCSIFILLFIFLLGNNSLACTIFYASDNNVTLTGNNEDWIDKDAKVWFLPSDGSKSGRIYFGFSNADPQGGMNDQGMFIDFVAKSPVKLAPSNFTGSLIEKVLEECSTLDQALDISKKNIAQCLGYGDFMIVDQYGSAAIISWDWNTNTLQINQQNGKNQLLGFGEPLLKPLFEKGGYDLSIEGFQKMLNYAHQGDSTIYSNVYDLKNRVVYLNYLHDFNNTVKFDLKKELQNGEHVRDIFSLFPQNQYNNLNSILDKNYTLNAKILLVVFILIFGSPFIIWFAGCVIKLIIRKKFYQTIRFIPFIAGIAVILNSIVCLVLIYYELKYASFIYNFGLDMFGKAIKFLPPIISILTIIEIILGIIIWKSKCWTLIERLYYSLLTLTSSFLVLVFININNIIKR